MSEADAAPAAEPTSGSRLFESMPLLGMLLAFDTRWRAFRIGHRRNDEVAQLHELFRPMAAEIHRLGMVEQFTGRFSFSGDAKETFTRCVEAARKAGLEWPDLVEIVNKAGEDGK
jgi:hypothetical protein